MIFAVLPQATWAQGVWQSGIRADDVSGISLRD
jgi:hypothetical protein